MPITQNQGTLADNKHQNNADRWSPVAPPTYANMKFNSFIFYVKTVGGISSEEAMDILEDSVDADVRFLRTLLKTPGVLIHRDSVEVVAGLGIMMAKTSLDEAGKAAILDNWPTA